MRPCVIPDCDRVHLARGLCGTHYARWWRGTLSPEHLALMVDRDLPWQPAAFCSCPVPVVQTFLGLPSCATCNKGFRP